MKHQTTGQTTVGLVKLCWLLGFSIIMLATLGGMAGLNVSATALDRGYLTNSQELTYIRQEAQLGVQPFAALVSNFMGSIDSPTAWSYGTVGGDYLGTGGVCVSTTGDTTGQFIHVRGGAQGVYEKMIAYYLTGNLDYAIVARQKILDLTRSYGFGGNVYSGANQCILELGFAMPLWIQAADLLEPTSIWSVSDKQVFQRWLANIVYPKVAWASNVRRNNWGAAGSLSASMLGDYLSDYNVVLNQISPSARQLSPAQAVLEANANQLQRMNTVWQGESDCTIYGIQTYGGIPDELRRGTTGCTGQWLLTNDSSFTYDILEIEMMTFHAEYLSRRGNMSIYNNMAADGSGSLLKAMLFVIANPINPNQSFDWTTSKRGVLFVANTHYHNTTISTELTASTTVRRGNTVAFAELTHVVDITVGTPISTATPVASSTATARPTNTPTAIPTLTATPILTTTPINTPTGGTTITLNPIADAYVKSDSPTSNYGADISLRSDASPTTRSYMRFTVPPLSGTVLSATLRIYVKSDLPLGFNIHSGVGGWQENTINFSNAPSFGSVFAVSRPSAASLWTDVVITGLITGAGNYNLVMTNSSTTSTSFGSRESGHKPQLVLVINGSVSSSSVVVLNAAPIVASPTMMPSIATTMPTTTPMATATIMPTSTALATDMPTNTATAIPTDLPTNTPTMMPTAMPTSMPTAMPTAIPTIMPTAIPTDNPPATIAPETTQNP